MLPGRRRLACISFRTRFLGEICTMQIAQNISQGQFRIYLIYLIYLICLDLFRHVDVFQKFWPHAVKNGTCGFTRSTNLGTAGAGSTRIYDATCVPCISSSSKITHRSNTPSTDNRFSLEHTVHHLHPTGGADLFQIWHELVHVARWDPCNLHDLPHVSWVASVLCRRCNNPSQRQVNN